MAPDPSPTTPAPSRSWGLIFLRYGLPTLLTVLGIAGIVAGRGHTSAAGAGVVFLGIALMVVLVNWLFRLSLVSNADRDREEEAREYFSRHGHWPGEGARGEADQHDDDEDEADR
jgi:hypothetical protein